MTSANDHDPRDDNYDQDPIEQAAAVTVDDGQLIIYDKTNHSAWIQSDTAVRTTVIR